MNSKTVKSESRDKKKNHVFSFWPCRAASCLRVSKDSETRPIMDGFRKNNVNYWVFSKIRSIIQYSLICALKPFFE